MSDGCYSLGVLTAVFFLFGLLSVADGQGQFSSNCIRHSPNKALVSAARLSGSLDSNGQPKNDFSIVTSALACLLLCAAERTEVFATPGNCQAAEHRLFENATRTCTLYGANTGFPNNSGITLRNGDSAITLNLFEYIESCFPSAVWAAWPDWDPCSQTCGGGSRQRQRLCTKVLVPGETAPECLGIETDQEACNAFPCPLVDNWSEWEGCSKTCGGGKQLRRRRCLLGTEEADDGTICEAKLEEEQVCGAGECPIWLTWNAWTSCNPDCGNGTRTRLRECSNEHPCIGEYHELEPCNAGPCSTWSTWSPWGDCSTTCGRGQKTRKRECQHGGACVGPDTEEDLCDGGACPMWEEWHSWGQCSTSCGGGFRSRTRGCVVGDRVVDSTDLCGEGSTDTRSCSLFPCPALGEWSAWSDCSSTCGAGTMQRYRNCMGGACDGDRTDEQPCDSGPCPSWGVWTRWRPCSASCGVGFRSRVRKCGNGELCPGAATSTEICDEGSCPTWQHWTAWSACTLTCGGGTKTKKRNCIITNVIQDSSLCSGKTISSSSCNSFACPDWAKWSDWGQCSSSCGPGTRLRVRDCQGGGCEGESVDRDACAGNRCPKWTSWQPWSDCSATCGYGFTQRKRQCRGGPVCPGIASQSKLCKSNTCKPPPYENWSPCTATCGGGVKTRQRSCSNTRNCRPDSQSGSCGETPCPQLSDWGHWSVCSNSCGEGTKTRSRACVGGNSCSGSTRNSVSCNFGPCTQWGSWQTWSPCSMTCGVGYRAKKRSCSGGSYACKGAATLTEKCEGPPCAEWMGWEEWSPCSSTCGRGIQQRRRSCEMPNERACDGPNMVVQECPQETMSPCGGFLQLPPPAEEPRSYYPGCSGRRCKTEVENTVLKTDLFNRIPLAQAKVGRGWSSWGTWSSCTGECGESHRKRVRECGEGSCVGSEAESESCSRASCWPRWTDWGKWSDCNGSCDRGLRVRRRKCLGGRGRDCGGKYRDVQDCILRPCIHFKHKN